MYLYTFWFQTGGPNVFFRTAVGRKLCTVGQLKSERQITALTRGQVYGVCIHMANFLLHHFHHIKWTNQSETHNSMLFCDWSI